MAREKAIINFNTNITDGKGIMYYVNHEYYLPMAKHSIESLNKVSELPITVFTSFPREIESENFSNTSVVEIPMATIALDQQSKHKGNSPAWRGKTYIYSRMPYSTTLYIDADTRFLKDPTEIMSDDYDIAACRPTNWKHEEGYGSLFRSGFCAGLIVFNRNEKVLSFLKRTEEIYDDLEKNINPMDTFKCNDQYALNESLSENPYIVLKLLSSEWSVGEPLLDLIKNPSVIHVHNLQHTGSDQYPNTIKDQFRKSVYSYWEQRGFD